MIGYRLLLTALCVVLLQAGSATRAKDARISVSVTPSGTNIKKELLGVSQGGNACSYLNDKMVAALDGLPIRLVRLEMITGSHRYKLYNPKDQTWNWENLDREIENIQKTGATIVANLFGTPPHLYSDPKAKIPAFTPPSDFEEYASFCAKILHHVNVEKKYGIKFWEFWNEPSGNYFWTTWRQNKDDFFKLYAMTAKELKKTDKTVLLGGIADNAYYPEHYENFFAYADKHKAPVDFITIHWYGEWNKEGVKNLQLYDTLATRIEKMYQKRFGKKAPVFYTEWNLPAESNGKHAAAKTAAFVGSALYWMQKNPYVIGSMLFRVQHYRDPYSSLLSRENKTRVLWRVLKIFSQLEGNVLKTSTKIPNVTVLAAGKKDSLAVMLNRYDIAATAGSEKSIELALNGLAPSATYNVQIFCENSVSSEQEGLPHPVSEEKVTTKKDGSINFKQSMEPFSVLFIKLTLIK